jgi:hypothetical protein
MAETNSSPGVIPQSLSQIRDLRFDGFSDTELADQIDFLHSGAGSDGVYRAVTALKKISQALSATDDALRQGLTKLNIHWHGKAGSEAVQVLTEKAGFAQEAQSKIDVASAALFSQGEAFNRIRNFLTPQDAEVLRKGADGYTVGDSLVSLFNLSTDHAQEVNDAKEKHATVVQSFTEYASASANGVSSAPGLSAAQTLSAPQPLNISLVGPFPGPAASTVLKGKRSVTTPGSRKGTSTTKRVSRGVTKNAKKSVAKKGRSTASTSKAGDRSGRKVKARVPRPVAGRPKYPQKGRRRKDDSDHCE